MLKKILWILMKSNIISYRSPDLSFVKLDIVREECKLRKMEVIKRIGPSSTKRQYLGMQLQNSAVYNCEN